MNDSNNNVGSASRRFDRQRRFLRARLSPEGYLGLHLTIGLLVVIGAGWWFGDIAEDVSKDAATRLLDDNITLWFQAHATPLLTRISLAITFFGSVLFLSSATAVVGLVMALRGNVYRFLALLLASGGGALLNLLLKHFFHRQRPVLENPLVTLSSFGFPSGHTMGATLFYGVLALIVTYSIRSWAQRALVSCAAALVIALIGISRIYLGAHYFTDVIGAIAIGLAWLAFCWTGIETLRRWRAAFRSENR
ncbi:MAG TPA: phosphatase PAP2 family protein [Chthoniobacterales bacterium]|nr:phosphatase PAP2 family protein [Chthoniobacterales bacterium]